MVEAPDVIRILIADDHPMVREGIKSLLASFADLEIVGEAVNGRDAVGKVEQLAPDVVLMDLMMPEMDGIEAMKRIQKSAPRVRILALTSFSTDNLIFPALRAGAAGYILKDTAPRDLVRSIREAHRGEATLHGSVARRVIEGLYPSDQPLRTREPLTERESEVLELVTRGLTNQEISRKLSVSQPTVRTHVSNILRKLRVANRVQAALYALKAGLVATQEPPLPPARG